MTEQHAGLVQDAGIVLPSGENVRLLLKRICHSNCILDRMVDNCQIKYAYRLPDKPFVHLSERVVVLWCRPGVFERKCGMSQHSTLESFNRRGKIIWMLGRFFKVA